MVTLRTSSTARTMTIGPRISSCTAAMAPTLASSSTARNVTITKPRVGRSPNRLSKVSWRATPSVRNRSVMRSRNDTVSASTVCTGSGWARASTARRACINSHKVTRVGVGRHALRTRLAREHVAAQQRALAERRSRLAVALILEQLAYQVGARIGFLALFRLGSGQQQTRLEQRQRRSHDQVLAGDVE